MKYIIPLERLPAREIKYLASHKCKHYHTLLEHRSCAKSRVEPKVVFCDVEISPQDSMTYGKFHEASILSVVRAPYIFCFSYAELGGKPKVVSLPQFSLYKRDPYDDREVVKELYKVLSSADYLVAHNISFDFRIAKARFMKHKLPPLKPIKTICTLKLARKIAQFPANTLKELALFLGVKHKMETSKYLWQKIHIDKDPKAWREMIRYNKIDTEVCMEIYKILSEWADKPLIQ